MGFEEALRLEFIKIGFYFVIVVIIGSLIAAFWNTRQKRREIELTVLGKLYEAYGKFISLRRVWNELKKSKKANDSKIDEKSKIFALANKLEGEVESILLRVTVEKKLSSEDIAKLGHFRQSFQALRESIRDDKELVFGYSEHPDYIALKDGTLFVSSIFNKKGISPTPSLEESKKAFKKVTSNKWENKT